MGRSVYLHITQGPLWHQVSWINWPSLHPLEGKYYTSSHLTLSEYACEYDYSGDDGNVKNVEDDDDNENDDGDDEDRDLVALLPLIVWDEKVHLVRRAGAC